MKIVLWDYSSDTSGYTYNDLKVTVTNSAPKYISSLNDVSVNIGNKITINLPSYSDDEGHIVTQNIVLYPSSFTIWDSGLNQFVINPKLSSDLGTHRV